MPASSRDRSCAGSTNPAVAVAATSPDVSLTSTSTTLTVRPARRRLVRTSTVPARTPRMNRQSSDRGRRPGARPRAAAKASAATNPPKAPS